MKKELLLQFIPGPEETRKSTHKIAKDAKINDYEAQALLTELLNLPRPLVEKIEFTGKRKRYRLWKKTKLDKDKLERTLRIKIEDRDTTEHEIVCRDKFYGNWGNYVKDIVKEVSER